LPGSLTPLLQAHPTDLGPVDGAIQLHLSLATRVDVVAARALAGAQSTPSSPEYHRWLTPGEFADRFSVSAAGYQRLIAWAQSQGLGVQATFPTRTGIALSATASAAERAFDVRIERMRLGTREFYAAVDAPSVPAGLGSLVSGVTGLDDAVSMTNFLAPGSGAHRVAGAQPQQSASGCGVLACTAYGPNDIDAAYDINALHQGGLAGQGMLIAIAGVFDWHDSDVDSFRATFGLPHGSLSHVCSGGVIGQAPGCSFDDNQSIEPTLDAEWSSGIAPAISLFNFMAQSTGFADFVTNYNNIASHPWISPQQPGINVVSTSWGQCEDLWSASAITGAENAMAAGVTEGETWLAASGDTGALGCTNSAAGLQFGSLPSVEYPASSPEVIGVGGTTLGAYWSGGNVSAYKTETGWSTGPESSGGGVSSTFNRPYWQISGSGINLPTGPSRLVPDVAMQADPLLSLGSNPSAANFAENQADGGSWVYFTNSTGGGWTTAGGTSIAAPQWAAILTMLTQSRGPLGLSPLVRFYQMYYGSSARAPSTQYHFAFHDVIAGSNGYPCLPGYDLMTGLGSVDAANLFAVF
jgi:subtilase family serine protease